MLRRFVLFCFFDRADVVRGATFDITLGATGGKYHECSK